MFARRTAVCLAIATLIAAPILVPCAYDITRSGCPVQYRDVSRWASLAGNTATLIAGVWAIALPLGTAVATVLARTDLFGRRLLLGGFAVALFTPLAIIATAWQELVGGGDPWRTGMVPAVMVHAIAGLPWVVWIVSLGVGHVETEVEEDALTNSPPLAVLLRVTLPRARASIGVAALWLALGCATEIVVTDVMQVRTFAEEVYTQTVLPEAGAPAEDMPVRAVAVAFPAALVTGVVVAAFVAAWQRRLPPLASVPRRLPLVRLNLWQLPVWLAVGGALAVTLVVPVATLVAQLGATTEGGWSGPAAKQYLRLAATVHGATIGRTIVVGVVAGTTASVLAVLACWSARRDRATGVGLLALTAMLWAMPGPVIGVALGQSIRWLLDVEAQFGGSAMGYALYYGPSALPAGWACLIRFFPFAVALIWPTVRAIPVGQFDMAALDGRGEFWHVVWPSAKSATVRAAVAVAILTFGEIAASKIVATAGGELFAHDVFAQMHYGPGNQLAALCLLLLALVLPPVLLLV